MLKRAPVRMADTWQSRTDSKIWTLALNFGMKNTDCLQTEVNCSEHTVFAQDMAEEQEDDQKNSEEIPENVSGCNSA